MRYQVTTTGTTHDVKIKQNDEAYEITVNGHALALDIVECRDGVFSTILNGKTYEISIDSSGNGSYRVHWPGMTVAARVERGSPSALGHARKAAGTTGELAVTTPMPGKIVTVLAAAGDQVKKGQGLVVVEAMKMENEFTSPVRGVVRAIKVSPGDKVESNAILALVEETS